MNVNIKSNECAWAHFDLKILGRTIRGLRGFEFRKAVEKEHLYGAGQQPLDIQEGNVACSGSITVLGFELDELTRAAQQAGYQDITEVPHEAITAVGSFQKRLTDRKTFISVTGISFSEVPDTMEQNAKYREVQLPFLAMDINRTVI